MIAIAGRYQALEPARPGSPQRARDLQTAQTVLLRPRLLPAEYLHAIARARAAIGIFHPSLVTLFDVVSMPRGHVLLAYEFVQAQTLAQLSGGSPFTPRRAAAIVAEIADAVAELHARDLAHGGISQATVLVTMKGKAKLDRVGDPVWRANHGSGAARDLAALGDLLRELAGRPEGRGVGGAHAIETLIDRARSGKFESAATLAGLLRRLAE